MLAPRWLLIYSTVSKTVLLFKYAEDAVAREEEKAIRRGETAYTEEKHQERLKHFLDYIPIKFHRARYASFTRYFDHLKRLGWVEVTGKTEPSEIQEHHPEGPPRVFYRLTEAGWKATPDEMRDPIMTLYPHYTRRCEAPSDANTSNFDLPAALSILAPPGPIHDNLQTR